MSKEIREIIDNENKIEIFSSAFLQYINKCKGLANRPIQGYGNCDEVAKKEQWAIKAAAAEELLAEICEELN